MEFQNNTRLALEGSHKPPGEPNLEPVPENPIENLPAPGVPTK
jgi:hypothetical protein